MNTKSENTTEGGPVSNSSSTDLLEAIWGWKYRHEENYTVIYDDSDRRVKQLNQNLSKEVVCAWISGFEEGYKRGEYFGEKSTQATIRQALGL